MSEENPSQEEIDELRRRWEAEPSPRLSLELAEEYRRAGETENAVSVLETALEAHPDHVAARVALGRYRLELGRHGGARSVLEGVVAQDPTHLVANKALVKVYAALGDEKQARDRLDLYRILNESDPEIDELELRIRGEYSPEAEVMSESGSTETVQSSREVVMSTAGSEPFAGLENRIAGPDYWQAFGSEGIFPVQSAVVARGSALEVVETEVAVEVESQEQDMATVTMANLYLGQGHLDEAESTFQRVLAREPDNLQAVEGLQAVLLKRGEADGDTPESRKIAMLKNYLERMRGSAGGK